ncbi:TRAP transporter large permease [Nocardioides sp. NPDC051685]|uniref:TRAP transporter large permease n=1 Tax=Nocardioides sp. NPDC051685 TaxID=3364334 RepID=UPI0037BDCCCD
MNTITTGSVGRVQADCPAPRSKARARRRVFALSAAAVAVALIVGYLFLVPSDRLLVGVAVVLLMIALMLLEVPIFITMIASAMVGMLVLAGERPVWGTVRDVVFTSFGSWSLSVIPMFVLMGVALSKTGIMAGAYDAARKWFGNVPGGLAVSTSFAGAGMAAISGSTMAITYAIGRVAIPEMIRAGYRPSLAVGSVATAGTLGQVIPPSVMLVIYAGVASTPVGPQLIAGVIPGLLLAVLFVLVIIGWGIVVPGAASRGGSFSLRERLFSLIGLTPVVLIAALVLGGIFSGFFTVTESGALGAVVALLIGGAAILFQVRRAGSRGEPEDFGPVAARYLSSTFLESIAAVASIFALLIGVNMLTRVMAISGLARGLADLVIDLQLSKMGFLLLLIPIYLILGFFLDTLAMMLLTIPVFLGPLVALDVDLIWFGIFLIVLAEIDLIAPPLGILNFVVLGIARSVRQPGDPEITIIDVFKGVTPFILACIAFLVLLVLFPEIATWLPSVSSSK